MTNFRTTHANNKAVNRWAQDAAQLLQDRKMEITDFRDQICLDHSVNSISELNGTAIHRQYYALRKVANTGNLLRIIRGESLFTVAREVGTNDRGLTSDKRTSLSSNVNRAIQLLIAECDGVRFDRKLVVGLLENANLRVLYDKLSDLREFAAKKTVPASNGSQRTAKKDAPNRHTRKVQSSARSGNIGKMKS